MEELEIMETDVPNQVSMSSMSSTVGSLPRFSMDSTISSSWTAHSQSSHRGEHGDMEIMATDVPNQVLHKLHELHGWFVARILHGLHGLLFLDGAQPELSSWRAWRLTSPTRFSISSMSSTVGSLPGFSMDSTVSSSWTAHSQSSHRGEHGD